MPPRAPASLVAVLVAAACMFATAFSPPGAASTSTRVRPPRGRGAVVPSPPPPSRLPSKASSDSGDFDDFADIASTRLTSDDGGDDGDPFLSSLRSRVRQVEDRTNVLPLMILDAMLPRQVLQIQIQHPTLKSLMKLRVGQETPTLGMLGMARLSTGRTVPLKTGVEVEIIQMERAAGPPSAGTEGGEEEPWDVSLRAGRRFVIEGEVEKTQGGWTEARVSFLDSSEEEEAEVGGIGLSADEGDRMSVARAMARSRQFTEPNANMRDGASLVERWIELARENERHPGQIDRLLAQLGDMPPEHEPTERALWVGALINPLPSMGVANEIRPALLVSKRAEERVTVALEGILRSIRHMDGTARMW